MNLNVTICGVKTEIKVLDEGRTYYKEEEESRLHFVI